MLLLVVEQFGLAGEGAGELVTDRGQLLLHVVGQLVVSALDALQNVRLFSSWMKNKKS